MTEFETRTLAHLAGIENLLGLLCFVAWAVIAFHVYLFLWRNMA
jgi:hypothetical protein